MGRLPSLASQPLQGHIASLQELACQRKLIELSPHIHILPAKVGKPVFATDNAQFFHQRTMRRRASGRKRRP
ncbi:hypothetical protein DBR45_32250 [Pseudomonas sp. HMWF031]|nr:hypothetical protein DBR45_32250 [Pseudomonas sp. HMWF031]